MTHRLTGACLFVVFATTVCSCRQTVDASYVEILRVVEPDASCSVSANSAPSTFGIYDPTINGADGYTISYAIKNNLAKAGDDVVALGELTNVHGAVDDVQILGFEGCWYLSDTPTTTNSGAPKGPIDCKTLPNQSGFFLAPQTALEGGDVQIASLSVLKLGDMQSLFGAQFDPTKIPYEGNVAALNPATTDTSLQYNVSLDTASPADPNARSVYWGANYPKTRAADVTVQMRAHVQTQSGTRLCTNWLSYPITVSPGLRRNACGLLIPKVCARGPCASGAACTASGTCADGTPCSNAVLPSGSQAAFNVSGACYPAQQYPAIPVTCVAVGCNATN